MPLFRAVPDDVTQLLTERSGDDLIPSLPTTSGALGTGPTDAANVKPGSPVVVVGKGAVGLFGVKQMEGERLAREFSADR